MSGAAAELLVTRAVFAETLAYLARHGPVEDNQDDRPLAPNELARRAADKRGLVTALTDRVDAALLAAAPRLEVVANIAVGVNNIDLAACSARGVMVTNTPGVLDESTADLVWALILGAARRVTEVEQELRAGRWTGWRLTEWLGVDVHHATLGVIGLGRIGRAIARRAAGFAMRLVYHNRRRLAPELERELGAAWLAKDDLLRESDVVVVQVPYAAETHHLIGARELGLMKPSAVLVNAARGGVVDDQALAAALASGGLRAAGLDVYEGEPALHPALLAQRNVVLLPHVGSATEATRRAMAMCAAENAVAALAGRRPPNLVNPEVWR